ncbi:serine--tRNA ligase [Candidatus Adlerbacteria bacterium RIFOXYC1_FULL_48_26]|uniref:Serine--tRNA ligase n=1 Tax=Candidatus Adlerbacteria bacterium RIFOXYC1_FULL_48_26 TaxID=1797247 RepID=A0A1F4Y382_9BACT|nr:MAG: serine--tRNA ligase [Candidatus Adlerbacteria bacterium RIFOXYC1_FULL_48_26]OGC93419.1 MAG: serine--tRNA ligase [Candidatus Adlerbacteria bacterium RIFOXYB1_FULL_48_10]
MLDIAFIRENPDIVRAAIKNKNREGIDLDRILVLAEERKNNANEISEINRQRNVAQEARDGEAGKRLKEELKAVEEKHQATEKELVSLLIKIPNIPSADTPIGPDESGNVVIRQWGEKPQFPFAPKAHWDLGKNLGIIDGEKAAEVSGARFVYLKGDMALLEMALMRFGFDTLISEETLKKIIDGAGLTVSSKPFTPVIPPILMRSQVMNRMARLDPIDERYYFEKDDMVFVGSAEHTLGPLHMDEILKEEDLPLRYAAMTPAFRREAGAAGKDTRGILRLHQFDKLEMETFSKPEDGLAEQNLMVAIQEYLLQQLKLPYQVVSICTGDMGFPDQRQIDIETWMPGQDAYRETNTSDYIGGFQARRLNSRVRRTDGTLEPVHMNDATAFSQRPLAAILENNQHEDGTITIPEVLRPYMGGREKIEAKK